MKEREQVSEPEKNFSPSTSEWHLTQWEYTVKPRCQWSDQRGINKVKIPWIQLPLLAIHKMHSDIVQWLELMRYHFAKSKSRKIKVPQKLFPYKYYNREYPFWGKNDKYHQDTQTLYYKVHNNKNHIRWSLEKVIVAN